MENVKLNTIEDPIQDFKPGNIVIVDEHQDPENQGD